MTRFVYPAAYMMASRRNGTLYIGSTNDLPRRAHEHRQGLAPGFTRDYGCRLLVWYEPYEEMTEAVRREHAIKHWLRAWKITLIEASNPEWRDVYLDVNL